jgi:hypothetical protein
MVVETDLRHLQDAPNCLLLWRKPPPALSGGGVFNERIMESGEYIEETSLGFFGFEGRQHDNERGAVIQSRLHPNPAVIAIHNGLYNGQAEA